MKSFVGKITFDDVNVKNEILDKVGNPLMDAYWKLVRKIIFW
jgi:hypothetical protein